PTSFCVLFFFPISFFFLMILPPPISPLFPYTTLFRSGISFFQYLHSTRYSDEGVLLLSFANTSILTLPLTVDICLPRSVSSPHCFNIFATINSKSCQLLGVS